MKNEWVWLFLEPTLNEPVPQIINTGGKICEIKG